MGVAEHLGVQAPEGDLLVAARARWTTWQRSSPLLGVCEDLLQVPAWTRQTAPGEVNGVLLALGELGAADGGEDPVASAALAWLLLPGAVGIARALAPLSERIDELMAAQLWICVRTVSWRRRVRVASTVLMNTRREVLRDLGVSGPCRAVEVLTDGIDMLARPVTGAQDNGSFALDRVHDLLAETNDAGVVTRAGDVAGGQGDLAATADVLHRQGAVLGGVQDGPPVTVFHPVGRCGP